MKRRDTATSRAAPGCERGAGRRGQGPASHTGSPAGEDPWLQEHAAHRAREALCPTPCAHTHLTPCAHTRLYTPAHTYTHTPLCTYNSTSPAHTDLMPLHTSAPCTSLPLRSLCLSSSRSSPVGTWFAGCCPGASARSLLGYVSPPQKGVPHTLPWGRCSLSRLLLWGGGALSSGSIKAMPSVTGVQPPSVFDPICIRGQSTYFSFPSRSYGMMPCMGVAQSGGRVLLTQWWVTWRPRHLF